MEASQAPSTITVVDAQILYVMVTLPYVLDEDAMRKWPCSLLWSQWRGDSTYLITAVGSDSVLYWYWSRFFNRDCPHDVNSWNDVPGFPFLAVPAACTCACSLSAPHFISITYCLSFYLELSHSLASSWPSASWGALCRWRPALQRAVCCQALLHLGGCVPAFSTRGSHWWTWCPLL